MFDFQSYLSLVYAFRFVRLNRRMVYSSG